MLLDLKKTCNNIPIPIVGVIHIGAHYGDLLKHTRALND